MHGNTCHRYLLLCLTVFSSSASGMMGSCTYNVLQGIPNGFDGVEVRGAGRMGRTWSCFSGANTWLISRDDMMHHPPETRLDPSLCTSAGRTRAEAHPELDLLAVILPPLPPGYSSTTNGPLLPSAMQPQTITRFEDCLNVTTRQFSSNSSSAVCVIQTVPLLSPVQT